MSEPKLSTHQKVVNWLFRETTYPSLSFFEWMSVLSATFIIRNRTFSQGFFDALADKINSTYDDTMLDSIKKDIVLYNALSYIAYASPRQGQVLHIKGIKYAIEKIPLTSGYVSSIYYAYGLKAVDDKNAQSILIFQGTTTPADHGFLAGVLADTRPVGAIGTQLYERGQEQIQKWISRESERTKQRVMCTGQSLGGAMSLHAYLHQPNEAEYFITNPPGLTNRELELYKKQPKEFTYPEPKLTVISHTIDPVFHLGSQYFPGNPTLYRHGNLNEHGILAHARAPDINNLELNGVQHDNNKRSKSYAWKIIKPLLFLMALIFLVLTWPIRLVTAVCHLMSTKEVPAVTPNTLESQDLNREKNTEHDQDQNLTHTSGHRFFALNKDDNQNNSSLKHTDCDQMKCSS